MVDKLNVGQINGSWLFLKAQKQNHNSEQIKAQNLCQTQCRNNAEHHNDMQHMMGMRKSNVTLISDFSATL